MFGQFTIDVACNAIEKSKTLSWLHMLDRVSTTDLMLCKHWHFDFAPWYLLCMRLILKEEIICSLVVTLCNSVRIFLRIYWEMSRSFSKGFVSAIPTFLDPCFMEVFSCATWNIWRIQNDFISKDMPVSYNRWKVGFMVICFYIGTKLRRLGCNP
jgi:hypothetical protein